MPTSEGYIDFNTQGTTIKQKMAYGETHESSKKFDLPFAYFERK